MTYLWHFVVNLILLVSTAVALQIPLYRNIDYPSGDTHPVRIPIDDRLKKKPVQTLQRNAAEDLVQQIRYDVRGMGNKSFLRTKGLRPHLKKQKKLVQRQTKPTRRQTRKGSALD